MRKRQRLVIVFILFVTLVCGGLGFGVWTVGVNIFQSAGPPGSPTVQFVIKDGETTAQIGDELQAQGLIRNSLAFRLWARYKGLDRRLQAGAYPVKASMTIPDIVDIFLSASPSEFWVRVPEGERIWQIAQHFATTQQLIKFKSAEFIQIAQTGNYTDATGKTVSLASQYWFLNHNQQGGSAPTFALEGYLFPDSYLVPLDASAADTIKLMLNEFGEKLCPGPKGKPDAYLNDEQGCTAHGVVIDTTNNQTIFDLLKKHYSDADGKSLADKLYHALTLASIVEREARTHDDRMGIASVYYNRYLVSKGEKNTQEGGLDHLQADPTLQYALGKPDKPWPQLEQGGNTYQLGPYDTYQNPGLPPSPICSPSLDAFDQAVNPANTNYFYFIAGKDGATHYAENYQQQQENINKYGVG